MSPALLAAVQNAQMVGKLLISIAVRYAQLVVSLDLEAQRAGAAGEELTVEIRDPTVTHSTALSSDTDSEHFGFKLDLKPAEWLGITKRVQKREIHGEAGLLQLIGAMVSRQLS
ncbi:hypothetical protein LTR37_019694 [Vermiconidia calcicola]|uniref:Uncharacterized protein n=1 Tax=Vermiconidia calcicola TaxID=1690605 RepID=A0ACC3MFA3_9PEZI|nr:hypothetical protein LTR37_019694 [Vermiconidia calcicola]